MKPLEKKFQDMMKTMDFSKNHRCIVAVSGGADSMALALLLQGWCKKNHLKLLAVTIDHGLRKEAAKEARQVKEWLESYGVETAILHLKNISKEKSLQEKARQARYKALFDFCKEEKISDLFIAHHAKDQIETILHRLVSGSGIDGLRGMDLILPVTLEAGEKIRIVRPLLSFEKSEIHSFLQEKKQAWIEDISNKNEDFTRIRMRKIATQLQEEGFDAKRVQKLSSRLSRAVGALDFYTQKAINSYCSFFEAGYVDIKKKDFLNLPEEIALRFLIDILQKVSGQTEGYLQLNKIEKLLCELKGEDKKTLMGCVIDFSEKEFIRIFPEVLKKTQFTGGVWDNRFLVSLKTGQTVRSFQKKDVAFFREKAKSRIWQSIPVEIRETLPIIIDEKGRILGNPLLGYAMDDIDIRHRFSCFYAQKG